MDRVAEKYSWNKDQINKDYGSFQLINLEQQLEEMNVPDKLKGRILGSLRRAFLTESKSGIYSIADLASASNDSVAKIRHLGPESLEIITQALEKLLQDR